MALYKMIVQYEDGEFFEIVETDHPIDDSEFLKSSFNNPDQNRIINEMLKDVLDLINEFRDVDVDSEYIYIHGRIKIERAKIIKI